MELAPGYASIVLNLRLVFELSFGSNGLVERCMELHAVDGYKLSQMQLSVTFLTCTEEGCGGRHGSSAGKLQEVTFAGTFEEILQEAIGGDISWHVRRGNAGSYRG
jgi:hypothetical protein